MGQVLTNQDVMEMNLTEELYIQYGRFCERHGIKDYKGMNNYEDYLNYGANNWENGKGLNESKKCYIDIVIKHQIINFLESLISNQYKVILVDNKCPITIDDDLEYWLYELLDNVLYIVRQGNTLIVIHNNKTKIKLTGYEDMSNGEIFVRQYLDLCECGLIVKDSLEQMELREDNFKKSEDYYNKCKDIISIRTVQEDDKNYLMNWDCIIVGFDNGEEIWQRA